MPDRFADAAFERIGERPEKSKEHEEMEKAKQASHL
jgi:hypothetical protein